MDAIRSWFIKYHAEITWFLIGWLSLAALYDLGRSDWTALAIDLILIGINLAFWKK